MSKQKIHLFAVDCQNDFCSPSGSLFVAGADKDMERLAKMIDRLGSKIDEIHATLDSHQEIHIAHSCFWRCPTTGDSPKPFTLITEDDIVNGKWAPRDPRLRSRALDYVKALKSNNRYVLCIWPNHTIIGSWGATVENKVFAAFSNWSKSNFRKIDYQPKGSAIMTENYSVVRADVIDPSDPTTMLNTSLINSLASADVILIAGEALSHCVANSVQDVADSFGDDNIKKFVLLEDCCSNVGGFENLGKEFVSKMTKRGMKVAKSTEYLA